MSEPSSRTPEDGQQGCWQSGGRERGGQAGAWHQRYLAASAECSQPTWEGWTGYHGPVLHVWRQVWRHPWGHSCLSFVNED